jgi:hypothetical protein
MANTDWTAVPNTSNKAKPTKLVRVNNARVVSLKKAFIRGSEVSGTFLLANDAEVQTYAGRRRIEVQCLWFGRKPKTTWMRLTLLSDPIFKSNFSGEVVSNIAL